VPTLLGVLGVDVEDVPDDIRRLLWDLNGRKGQPGENWWKREVTGTTAVPIGHAFAGELYGGDSSSQVVPITAPATDAARQWDGWGTALKPAHEPIVVARKPLDGTVVANVLEYGTGALNIDGCRVSMAEGETNPSIARYASTQQDGNNGWQHVNRGANFDEQTEKSMAQGRWPANFVLTHAADCGDDCALGCPVAALDEQSGEGASRFFTVTEWDDAPFRYVAKPSRAERNAGTDRNIHPTVKPLDLMRWLVRLVTPPGGVVLDPFAGSGTTLAAAILEGLDCVGVEMTDDYLPLIEGRCTWAEKAARFGPVTGRPRADADDTPTLFDVEDDK
jgi:site-specific DNA-methyltransferase (adenine-specific)